MPFRLSYGVVQGVSFLTGKKSFGSENRYLALRERKDRYSMVLKTPFFNFDQLILEEKKTFNVRYRHSCLSFTQSQIFLSTMEWDTL